MSGSPSLAVVGTLGTLRRHPGGGVTRKWTCQVESSAAEGNGRPGRDRTQPHPATPRPAGVPAGEIGAGYDVLRGRHGPAVPGGNDDRLPAAGGMSKSPGIMSDG